MKKNDTLEDNLNKLFITSGYKMIDVKAVSLYHLCTQQDNVNIFKSTS